MAERQGLMGTSFHVFDFGALLRGRRIPGLEGRTSHASPSDSVIRVPRARDHEAPGSADTAFSTISYRVMASS
eukprot:521206-Rhodomonas_salina.5